MVAAVKGRARPACSVSADFRASRRWSCQRARGSGVTLDGSLNSRSLQRPRPLTPGRIRIVCTYLMPVVRAPVRFSRAVELDRSSVRP